MRKLLLITRPQYEPTTHYLFHWNQKVIDFAKKRDIDIIDLQRERANRKEFTNIVVKRSPRLILFNGHGSGDSISGQDNEILVKIGENENLLKNKIIYALSCETAKLLGPESVSKGAVSYLGYDDVFIFYYSYDKIDRPLEDKRAALFLEPSNQVAISLLKGHTTGDAHQRSKKSFLKNIQKLLTSESAETYLVRFLIWDMRHQVCLGNQDASLKSE